ncbi:MAG: TerD family protein [Candidatus Obscuribacterales bacterium]|nr:TerD family protein [Candidatus Obscuribacterales bacterium]
MSVNLIKGQRVNLTKGDGSPLTAIMLGLGWDVARGAGSIDLDASCLMFGDDNKLVETVYFRQLKSSCGSVKHSGDNLTGAGDGDDETISVALTQVPAKVKSLVFTVNSYRGQTFDRVENAVVRLVNTSDNSEAFRYDLAAKGAHTGLLMCKLYRHNGAWKLAAIGEPASGRTAADLVPAVLPHL